MLSRQKYQGYYFFYLYRTLERTGPNQREYRTYAQRRIEGSVGVQTVVSYSNPF